ncbi:MAG TPA: NAD-dependent malic enzyme [bacterium]|jgi:malate dehydrogenase (oxaloacetate-decarboxylating)
MKRFEMRVDPLTQEIYYEVPEKGYALMRDPLLNKGSAFPYQERNEFHLTGLITDSVGSLEHQIERAYENYSSKRTDLGKYIALESLLDRNETLFYALMMRHLEEMLPIVYTPTVGQACTQMSHIMRHYRGVYITPQNVVAVEEILESVGLPNISLIVVTDGERILGLGDLGANGMGIPIGKLALYIAAAGIHPASTLPICLDVGTNNQQLLDDHLYLGIRQRRLTGDAYYEVVERFVQGVRRMFPRALLQWEDFGKHNAFNLLDRYSHRLPCFNDDIQGTGATAAAALMTAKKITGRDMCDERVAILGFGQAGSGVANAICTMMHEEEGTPLDEARRRIFAFDLPGLLMDGMKVEPYQAPFCQPSDVAANWPIPHDRPPTLAEVVEHGKITTLIGLSAQPGVFDEPLLRKLMKHCDRPVVLALSNPTAKCETTPDVVMRATDGRALMATGSPFAPVRLPNGRELHISQCNNLYIFPGVGLGAIVCQASRVTHSMFHAASCAISKMVSPEQRENGMLLPSLKHIRQVSFEVAMAVARQAREEGLGIRESDERLEHLIHAAMWEPHYYPYRSRPMK